MRRAQFQVRFQEQNTVRRGVLEIFESHGRHYGAIYLEWTNMRHIEDTATDKDHIQRPHAPVADTGSILPQQHRGIAPAKSPFHSAHPHKSMAPFKPMCEQAWLCLGARAPR